MSIFWNFVTRMTAGTLARASDVNVNLDGIDAGFDLVEAEFNEPINAADVVVADAGGHLIAGL